MSSKSSRGNSWDSTSFDRHQFAFRAFEAWRPFFAGMMEASGQASDRMEPFLSEWQNFIGHRIDEDVLLWRRLSESRTLQDVTAATSHFWHKAAIDYWQQTATLGKLVTAASSDLMSEAGLSVPARATAHAMTA
jgi:hypothetical protein